MLCRTLQGMFIRFVNFGLERRIVKAGMHWSRSATSQGFYPKECHHLSQNMPSFSFRAGKIAVFREKCRTKGKNHCLFSFCAEEMSFRPGVELLNWRNGASGTEEVFSRRRCGGLCGRPSSLRRGKLLGRKLIRRGGEEFISRPE